MLLTINIEAHLVSAVKLGLKYLKEELIKELEGQGHVNTGKLIKESEIYVETKTSEVYGAILMLHYAKYLERGVKAGNIPFKRGSGAGSSQYIQGLMSFFKKKGLSGKELKAATFATANKHKKEGMPTRASFRFANNNRRKEFVSVTYNNFIVEAQKIIEDDLFPKIDLAFQNVLKISA